MAETINGSKSSNYIKEEIPGVENSSDSLTHLSVQNLWNGRGAADVLIHAVYTTQALPFNIEAGSVKRLIKITGHGAAINDFIRMNDGNSSGEEVSIVKIIDADFIVIAKEINVAVGDEVFILKNVTPTYNKDGSLNVTNGPVQFIKDALVQQVIEDTVVPANNEPLPSKIFINMNGVMLPVGKDSVTPANSVLLPVEVSGVSGPINITAGDLNVQLSDLGPNFDRTRIGNGTNQWDVNAAGEGLVRDADSIAELADINTKLDTQTIALGDINAELDTQTTALNTQITAFGDINTELDTQTTALGDINTELNTQTTALGDINTELNTQSTSLGSIDTKLTSQATAAKQDLLLAELQLKADLSETQPVSIASMPSTPITNTNLDVALSTRASEANLNLTNVLLGAVNSSAPGTDTAASGLNGRLQRIAQNISAMILQLPSTLGIKTAALSLSIAPASDAIFNTKGKALTGSFAELLTLTTVQTFTAPANAVGALIQASDANVANIRIKQGAAATTTSGIQMQAGRSESLTNGTDISVCSESGTNAISVIWSIQA